MKRSAILTEHFERTKETLMGLSARCGIHYVTLSKIKNGANCLASTWDAIYAAIRTDNPQHKTSGEKRDSL